MTSGISILFCSIKFILLILSKKTYEKAYTQPA